MVKVNSTLSNLRAYCSMFQKNGTYKTPDEAYILESNVPNVPNIWHLAHLRELMRVLFVKSEPHIREHNYATIK